MRKSEIDILMNITKNKCSLGQLMSSRVAMDPYLVYSVNSLLERGYLKGSRERGYQLTLRSIREIRRNNSVA